MSVRLSSIFQVLTVLLRSCWPELCLKLSITQVPIEEEGNRPLLPLQSIQFIVTCDNSTLRRADPGQQREGRSSAEWREKQAAVAVTT